MHTHSKARIPQVIIMSRHQPFIGPFTKLLGQVAGAAEEISTTCQALSKTTL